MSTAFTASSAASGLVALTKREQALLTGIGRGVRRSELISTLRLTPTVATGMLRRMRRVLGAAGAFSAFEAARTASLLDDVPPAGQWWWFVVTFATKATPDRASSRLFTCGTLANEDAARAALRCLSCTTERQPVLSTWMRRPDQAGRWTVVEASPCCDQVPESVQRMLLADLRPLGSARPGCVMPVRRSVLMIA